LSSNSPAARRNTSADVIKKIKMQEKINAAQRRRQVSGTGPVSFGVTTTTIGGFGGFNPNINIDTGKLSVAGDVMMGPIAFNPQDKTISSGTLTISGLLNQSSSYIIVNGEGSANDDLNTIAGAQFAGQFLVLKAKAGVDITLKHLADNITIPGGADHVMTADTSVVLVFDNTLNKWMLVASHAAAGGGGGTEVPDWTEAHRANGYTLFLDADDNSNINAAVDDQVRIQTGGTTRMTWENSLITISDTVDVDPSSDGGVNLGSSSKQYGQVHSQTFSTWTDTTNDTTSTEAKIFRNSTRGLTFKSPSVGGSFGKHTFTDKDGVTRVEFDYNASSKLNNFNYSTQGLRVRKNADVGDTIDIVPPGNPLFGNNAYLNANGNAWTTSSPDDGLIISRVGLEKMKFTNSLIEVNEATDFSDEPISSVGEISFRLSTHKISSDFTGIDYETPSGDTHQFFVAGARIVTIKDTGIDLNDNEIIKPESGDVIGIGVSSVGATMSNVGSQGSLQIPYVVDIVAPTKAQLDSWFGNQDRCMGYALAAGPTLRLYVRDSGVWRYFDADGFVS